MNEANINNTFPYLDILFLFIFMAFVSLLYFALRSLISNFLISKEKPEGLFLSRLSLPVVLLLVTFLFKIEAVRTLLPVSQKFFLYIDAAFFFFVVFFLIRLIDASLKSIYAWRGLSFPLPKVLHGLILGIIYLLIVFIILKDVLHVNITPFLATSAILTMILGLAFQGVLSNVLAGMSLHFTQSFRKGDWIQVGSDEGRVIDTNWRETRIHDRYSNIVVLPNNLVASEKITNFSMPIQKSALTISVKASYEAPPSSVFKALLEAAGDVPEVLAVPSPEAYLLNYDDLGISYLLKFWIKDFDRKYPIMAEVGRLIWYKFKRSNIEIPVPLADKVGRVLRSIKEKEVFLAEEKKRERNYLDLLNSSFLRYQQGKKAGELMVSEKVIRDLAQAVKRVKYAPGEIIFKQGERGEKCYLISSGKIRGEIVYEDKGKKHKSVFVVKAGDIFGEMSLFTGLPRTATGIVEEETELLEIRAEDFGLLLDKNPKLAEIIAEIVSLRNKKNKEFLKKIKELSEKDIKRSCSKRSVLKWLKGLVKK
ncbi:MAG: cyclic nucleotide-binding domain-containing protein [Candidatus Aminicenantales bacterium]